MGPEIRFDSELDVVARGWSWPIRSVVSLMVMIALSTLSMTVMARGTRRPTRPATPVSPIWNVPRTDRFVIAADPTIDPKMVAKADPTIDPKMVVNPEAGARQALPIAPALANPSDDPPAPRRPR